MSLPPAHDPGPATPRELGPHAAITDPAHLLPAHAVNAPAKGSWLRRIILLAILLGVVGFSIWRIRSNNAETAAIADRQSQASSRATPVLTSAVQSRTVPVYLTALGTVTAYNTVTLRSRVDGQLLSVNFREGQDVHKGQMLLQIDPRPYQAALDQALGTLSKDKATQKNAEAEAQRYTALYQAGVVSKESQQTQLTTAGQTAGSIQADNAAIEAAKVNLGYTRIYSPINGVVGLRGVDPGNIVHASDSTGLVVITQIHPIATIFTLPEDQLPQVQQAMKGGVKLVVEAYDRADAHKIATGSLVTIDNQIDTTTGTAKLKAVFDNTDNALFANQFVNIRLVLRQRENAIVVPTAAIQSGTQGTFVYVVHPGPTPANKRPAGGGAGPGGGSRRRGDGGGAGGASGGGAPSPSSSGEATPGAGAAAPSTSGGRSGGGGKGGRGGAGGPQGPPMHVDAVPVHVDFTQGSNSILAAGSVKEGDKVVIDGQEKLIDGANVAPQQAPPSQAPSTGNPGSATGPIGAGTAAPPSTADPNLPSSGSPRGPRGDRPEGNNRPEGSSRPEGGGRPEGSGRPNGGPRP